MPPIPAEARTPTDRDWHTEELPATPQRDFLIPAERWVEAPEDLQRLGADLGYDLVAYKRRIGRYMAVAADDLAERWTFRLTPDGTGAGEGPDGRVHTRFRTWKEALRDAGGTT